MAKMALERRVKDLENSLEASRKEQETSRRELEDARKRAAASSGAEGGAAAELGEVRALLEQAEAQAAEEHVQAAAAELAAAVVAADGGPIVSLIAATATQAETAPAVAGAMQAAMEVDGWSLGGYGQGGQPAERRKSPGASGSESESSRASAG